jgi:hypothetical protein
MTAIYKVLGQVATLQDTNTTLYTVPSGKQAVISTIVVANRGASSPGFRIAVRPSGAAISNEHYLAFDVAVTANDSTTITLGITLSENEVITVRATNADLTFSAFGTEIEA